MVTLPWIRIQRFLPKYMSGDISIPVAGVREFWTVISIALYGGDVSFLFSFTPVIMAIAIKRESIMAGTCLSRGICLKVQTIRRVQTECRSEVK
ncbi:hypothetical protein NPIL_350371 [Nephila pilipes]|uniref:Uncharacterized protein n=1 Tax=Nephila pilipes TaxID=299642 RepID=A0A8X6JW26_NEPPI|nr:hypothetical protein NPIL_350371 [Nephila pilipes]